MGTTNIGSLWTSAWGQANTQSHHYAPWSPKDLLYVSCWQRGWGSEVGHGLGRVLAAAGNRAERRCKGFGGK